MPEYSTPTLPDESNETEPARMYRAFMMATVEMLPETLRIPPNLKNPESPTMSSDEAESAKSPEKPELPHLPPGLWLKVRAPTATSFSRRTSPEFSEE